MDSGREDAAWKHIVAGAFAGVATSFVTTPLDVVKTRLQNQVVIRCDAAGINPTLGNLPSSNPSTTIATAIYNKQGGRSYSGTWPSLWRIYRAEGIRGLYRGLNLTVVGYLPSLAIYFSTYSQAKRLYAHWLVDGDQTRTPIQILSAMTAGATSATATNPLWVVRTRRMLKEGSTADRGIVSSLRRLYRREGLTGWYRGLAPSLLGTLHVAVQLPAYEKLKQWQHRRLGSDSLDTVSILQCSTASKILASMMTYPHEVLRTRIQNERSTTPEGQPKPYRGVISMGVHIWRAEGWRSFYRGLPTTILRVVPASAVTFVTYEYTLSRL